MKAGVVHAPNRICYEDIETPIPKDKELLVKVKYTGVCGSDIPRVNGKASHYYPNILGHEFSGTVEEVGSGVSKFSKGDRVVGIPLIPCMNCEACLEGDYALCNDYVFIGSSRFGSFSQYIVIPETNALKIEANITFEQGAFFEPATIALHGIRRVDYQGGGVVAILGCGTIGIMMLQWARIFGAKKIVVFDKVTERLELAKKFGADEIINTTKDQYIENALQLVQNKGFDFVFETAGNTNTIKDSFKLVGHKSKVCLVGTPTSNVTFSVEEWEMINRKEFFLTGSWMSYSAPFPGREWELTAHYFQNKSLKIDDSFIFEKIPLSKISEAFELFKLPGKVKGKILIDSEK